MSTLPFSTGWVKDLPDFRDKLYKEVLRVAGGIDFPVRGWFPCTKKVVYPDQVDLTAGENAKFWPEVLNQGRLGSCTSNATVATLAYIQAKDGGTPLLLSRLFIYWNARLFKNEDTGLSIRAAFKTVAKYGDCKETEWPYDVTEFKTKPSASAYTEAEKRKGLVYARLLSLNDMLHCLASGYPFVFGMSLYDEFSTLGGYRGFDCSLPMPNADKDPNYLGGHALCCVGYDLPKKLFKCRNSWGPEWGDGGHFWLPFDYLSNPLLSADFWTARKIPYVL